MLAPEHHSEDDGVFELVWEDRGDLRPGDEAEYPGACDEIVSV